MDTWQTSNTPPQSVLGSCLCGAVSVEVLLPVKWVAHCHCTLCQRAHGAAFVSWFGVDTDKANIIDPKEQLNWYASSALAQRGFCGCCGSSLFFRSGRWPGELHIALACMQGSVGALPMAHVFYDSHVDWFSVQDELVKKSEAEMKNE
ncbi:GFA family protein [Shewanella sp. JM162201]|uniref:GFA family protein n=1 Tax=Shewanella jiangmenensis TaxID=2837387 RepID=A0ABS5V1M9_9GAMM|nr:GFA family protein [Shewanella jiangmenensis]MBT1444374.1 GFA family protein [Shewanella jiangmenensis]